VKPGTHIDNAARAAHRQAMLHRLAAALAVALALCAPAYAIVGTAEPASDAIARHIVMVVGDRGSACTGTAIGRDLVLTAAHCVEPGVHYTVAVPDPGRRAKTARVERFERHPEYVDINALEHRETADMALIKLAEPLPGHVTPATLGSRDYFLLGDRFIIAGYGIDFLRGTRSFGTLKWATLMAVRHPSSLQLRLADPITRGESAGLGACSGDSGGPVFEDAGNRLLLVAVVSWATAAQGGAGCGGLTGVTPLGLARGWIAETAARLGGRLGP
jgi:secreted trypsin-like serine protease